MSAYVANNLCNGHMKDQDIRRMKLRCLEDIIPVLS